MIKFVTFASEIRAHALLCSSAAVLLTACGGSSVDEPLLSAAKQQTQTAGTMAINQAPAQSGISLQAAVQQSDVAASSLSATADLADPDNPSAQAAGPEQFAITGYGAGDSTPDAATNVSYGGVNQMAPSADAAVSAGNTRAMAAPAGDAIVTPATTYKVYVAPNGSDTAAGSASAPFKTLARAAKAARASTTVYVAPGTYAGGVKTTVHGTASARIYYVSTTKWGARIVPPASSSGDFAWDNRGNYVDIIGFRIDGSVSQSGKKWTHGIYNGGSYDMIRSNWVHNIAKSVPCTSAGGSAIGVDSYYRGIKSDVVGNLVHDIGPAGCRFVQGIYISTSGSVKNNVVYRVAEGAIHLWHDANNVIITNNTVTTSNTGIIVGGGDFYFTSGPNDYTAVYSNIVYDNKMGISEQGKTGRNNSYRNNLVYQNPTYNFKLNNGLTHTGTVTSAPLLVNYTRTGTPNLSLTSSSPAIGRGTSTHALSYDFNERPRNASTGYDIGAYQHY